MVRFTEFDRHGKQDDLADGIGDAEQRTGAITAPFHVQYSRHVYILYWHAIIFRADLLGFEKEKSTQSYLNVLLIFLFRNVFEELISARTFSPFYFYMVI